MKWKKERERERLNERNRWGTLSGSNTGHLARRQGSRREEWDTNTERQRGQFMLSDYDCDGLYDGQRVRPLLDSFAPGSAC